MRNEGVSQVFHCLSGNTGLTEQFIYNNILNQGEEYQVLSSATLDNTEMGILHIDKKNTSLVTFTGKPGILIARNGKAGQMKYLEKGRYVTNDHAYILSLRDSFKQKYDFDDNLEEDFLKYFIFRYQHDLYQFSSNNDNATWNKTAFLKYFSIEIPDPAQISKVAFQYHTIIEYRNFLQEKILELDDLLNKTVIL